VGGQLTFEKVGGPMMVPTLAAAENDRNCSFCRIIRFWSNVRLSFYKCISTLQYDVVEQMGQ